MAGAGRALPTIAQIQSAVALRRGVPVAIMREPVPHGATGRNIFPHAHARQEAMRLASLLTDHSYTRIGFFFGGRDHSTVLSACKRVDARRTADPELDRAMKRMSLELTRGAP